MGDLEIPDASAVALLKVRATWATAESFDSALHSIADPVVVAELRRLADRLTVDADIAHRTASTATSGLVNAAVVVRARAAELDGGQR